MLLSNFYEGQKSQRLQDGKRFAQKAPLCATHPSRGGAFHGTRLPAAGSFPALPECLPEICFLTSNPNSFIGPRADLPLTYYLTHAF